MSTRRLGRHTSGSLAVVGLLALAANSQAAREPAHLAGHDGLELADRSAVRSQRALAWHQVPRAAHVSWNRLRGELGPATYAVWDAATGVPSRIWGAGIAVPSSVSSPAVAAAFARGFLNRHLALLAPGTAASDFVLVSNDLDDGMRTIGFAQHASGVAVLGGQVSFRFKADRLFMIGSEASPSAVAAVTALKVPVAVAESAAEAWLTSDVATVATASAVEGPFVLPLVAGHVRHRTVARVVVATDPIGKWSVFVDAVTGEPVAREQTLRFATGTVAYEVPRRRPGAERVAFPATFTNMTVDGASVVSDANGQVTWASGSVSVGTGVAGAQVTVNNTAGGQAATTLSLASGGSAVWNVESAEFDDAQLTTFIHTNQVIEYARSFAGDLDYLATQVQANVNINDTCNAFYDGDSINFFRQAGNCGNTGRLADVVYHEFGHSLHDHGIIEGVGAFDGAASEGLSDFLAATITGDSGMGRGFFNSDEPLREIDPPGAEHSWPEDIGEIHYTGLIIGGALWDMRKELIATLGEPAGVEVANRIFYQAMRRAVDIPTMYFEALAADDDDGDLTNGTPHVCEINAGFTPHGLREFTALGSSLTVAPPHQDGYRLSLALTGLQYGCPSDEMHTAEVEWQLRSDTTVGGTLPMSLGETGFEATIPTQPDGSVVQYRVRVSFDDGSEVVYPNNAADPFYELFVGHVVPLYCTDFETDPALDGWTHGLTSGEPTEGADDWQWGPVGSPPDSGDPGRAYSGDNVFGNDLGGGNYNGLYQANKVNYAESPVIDTSGYEIVRLQYRRWLTIEDRRFDQATIYADGESVWSNYEAIAAQVDHIDEEWRFSDVELSAQAADGSVQVRFELGSDAGGNLGGWNIDDFCVVGYVPTVCGDGLVTGLEACDDGAANSDSLADACRADCVPPACGDGVVDSGEACDDGNLDDADGCDSVCVVHGDDTVPGDDTLPGDDDGFGLEGKCGCHIVGGSERSMPYAWLFALALAFASRRRR